jgi:hypothetical protein
MKKRFRFWQPSIFRFSLKTFLLFVFCFAAVLAWLAHADREHRREQVAIAGIKKTALESKANVDFFRADNMPEGGMVFR